MMPTSATVSPPMVARSGRAFGFFRLVPGTAPVAGSLLPPGSGMVRCGGVLSDGGCDLIFEDALPELDDTLNYQLGALAHPQNLAGGKRDHRVRSDVNMLDEIRVQHHGFRTQARQMNHGKLRN